MTANFARTGSLPRQNPEKSEPHLYCLKKRPSEPSKVTAQTIAFTYSEPTVWSEYVLDISAAAKKEGVHAVVVSNGTWTPEVLQELLPLVKAVKIDLKSIKPDYYQNICNAQLKPVLDNILAIKKAGVWLELVNLVVTTLNDSDENFRELARWINTYLGSDVPLHYSPLSSHVPPKESGINAYSYTGQCL